MSVFANQPHGWVFLVLLSLSVLAVFRFYRRVPPTVGRGLRLGLVVLRSTALALLFFILLEPVLALSRVLSERPVVAVLLDTSRSMAIVDGTGGLRRGGEAVSLLNEIVLPRVARDAEIVAYAFSSGIEPLTTGRQSVEEAPRFDGEVTDIGAAIKSLSREVSGRNLGAVVIATDGANNRGASPYDAGMALGVPIFALGLGSTEAAVDIAIREAVTNRISYTGEVVPIEVRISSAGFADAETVVELSEGDILLDSKVIELSRSGGEVEVTFRVVPSSPGVHRYRVSVPPAPGELTTTNNSRVVATTALKGKIRALLVAPRPSWDFAFLRRELEGDRNVELAAFAIRQGATARRDRRLPASREELLEYDLVVLIEPDWADPPIPGEWLVDFVRDRGGGLLVVGPPGSDAPMSGALPSILPVLVGEPGAAPPREMRVRLTEAGEAAPMTRVVRDRFENAETWKSLPPIWAAAVPRWTVRPDAVTLVVASGAGGEEIPVGVTGRAGAGSVFVVLAEGIWRWKMAGPEGIDVYDRFVANTARRLTARGELERVSVTTNRDVYAAGEPVVFSAQVYREDFRLTRNASITVSASRGGEGAVPVGSVVLAPDGDFYKGELGPMAPGRYVFEARALEAGEDVGTASGEFTVEEFSLEDSEVRRRPAVLRKLAEDSGGSYHSPETVDGLPESVPLERRRRISAKEIELWNSPWFLVAFVCLLSAEWTLRRRKGLP